MFVKIAAVLILSSCGCGLAAQTISPFDVAVSFGTAGDDRRGLTAGFVKGGTMDSLIVNVGDDEASMQIEFPDSALVYLREDGNLEWEIILPDYPETSILDYPMIARGLAFHFQPGLSFEEITMGAERPDSVVGSYAVYRTDSADGRDNLGTGKVFHIYAPYAWDESGKMVKCSLRVSREMGHFRIFIPDDFLSTAKYPVRVDPQFGNSTVGASSLGLNVNYSASLKVSAPESGQLDSIVVYVDEDAIAGEVGGAIYSDNSGCYLLLDTTETQYATGTDGWYQMPMADNVQINGNQDYWLSVFCGSSPFDLRYDVVGGRIAIRDYNDPWPPPDPCNSPTWTHNDYLLSIYAVYSTSAGSGETISRRIRILNLTGGMHE